MEKVIAIATLLFIVVLFVLCLVGVLDWGMVADMVGIAVG